jgi:hypothetical protein
MGENIVLLLLWLRDRERCPWCGSMDNRDYDHMDGCPTINTCAQIGPPWVLSDLHPDDPLHPRKGQFETLGDYYARCREWNANRRQHLCDTHGMARVA